MNGTEAVRDDEGRFPPHQFHDRAHDGVLRAGIQGARRLIEKENRSILEKSAGDADALALPDAQVAASLSDRTAESTVCM